MGKYSYYEVRVKKLQGIVERNGKEVPIYKKVSRFYWAKSPSDAASCYKGEGRILSIEKVPNERILGVGAFFKLGDDLLRTLRKEGNNDLGVLNEKEIARVKQNKKRGYYARARKKAADRP